MADMTQQELTSDALRQVRDIFSEMDEDAERMEVDQTTQGKRGHTSPTKGSLKAPRLAGKGRGQGQETETTEQEPAANPASQPSNQNPRTWTREQRQQRHDEQWKQWEADSQWYQNQEMKRLQKELEVLKEQMRLLARIALRHEDELSQRRTESDFLITFEPLLTPSEGSQSNMLLKLFKTVVMWKTKRESGAVDTPLRLTLFLGMLVEYEKRISINVEQPEDLELLAQQKLLRQKPDGGMEWPYLRWNTEKEVLEESPTLKPLDHADLMKNLKILQQSITAPGALLRFHSTRKLVESHQSPLTFLVSIGMRDPQSLLCWRALSELCFNSSGRLLRMRIRPARMERQPLVRVLAEQFPPPEQPMGSGRGWKDKRRSPARTSPGRDKPTGHGKKKEEKDQASDLTTDPASLPSQPAPMETAVARAS